MFETPSEYLFAMRRKVNSICDIKTDDLRRQHFKYNTVIP